MAMAIQRISTVDVAAGYDILSFNGRDRHMSTIE